MSSSFFCIYVVNKVFGKYLEILENFRKTVDPQKVHDRHSASRHIAAPRQKKHKVDHEILAGLLPFGLEKFTGLAYSRVGGKDCVAPQTCFIE